MNLSLSTPEGDAVEVTPVEMPDEVKAASDAFHRAQANDPLMSEKTAPPKRKPRPQAQADGDAPKRGRPSKADAARTTTTAPAQNPAKKAQTNAERKAGVMGLVQVGSGICLVLDQRTPENDVSFRADAYVLAANSEAIADAVVETCEANEGFARAVDKITAAGPYAALLGVMMSVGMQLAANHGVPMARAMGAADPRDVVQAFEAA